MNTISTHLGKKVRRNHNIRDARCVAKEPHIHQGGIYEIWADKPLQEAYEEIFGDAVAEYNENQKRADRRIGDYLQTVQQDGRRVPCYEMIAGIYTDPEDKDIPERERRQILREYMDGWERRNPNLRIVGTYYHADEDGQPHIHIDFVPVGEGYKRGMQKQASMDKALKCMGYQNEGRGSHGTPVVFWEKAENAELERICQEHGISIEHPDRGTGKHLETEIYKLEQEKKTLLGKAQALRQMREGINRNISELKEKQEKEREKLAELSDRAEALEDILNEAEARAIERLSDWDH